LSMQSSTVTRAMDRLLLADRRNGKEGLLSRNGQENKGFAAAGPQKTGIASSNWHLSPA
jgi:hypothetical protein